MPTSSLFQDIQSGIKTRLATSDEIKDIPVFLEELGDPVSDMNLRLAKTGMAIYVANPAMFAQAKDTPGPYFAVIQVAVMIYEIVSINRSTTGLGITAGRVAECVAALLHQHTPSGLAEIDIATDRPAITSTIDEGGKVLAYTLNFDTHGGLTVT